MDAPNALTVAYHELRSPLALVITAARAAAAEARELAVQRRCEAIVRAAERMLATAERLLQGEAAGGLPQRFRPASIAARIVEDRRALGLPVWLISDSSAIAAEAAGDPVTFECLVGTLIASAGDHGDRIHGIEVRCDATRAGIWLSVENAIDFARAPGHGLGTGIAAALAAGLGAELTRTETAGRYIVELLLPSAPAA